MYHLSIRIRSLILFATYYLLCSYLAGAGNSVSLSVSSTLAVSNIRNRTYTNYEVYLIGYGYGKFKEKIHFME